MLNAYATSPETMIVARALLGVAGATLMPSTLALIRNLFHDPRERSLAIGIWGAMASAGAAVGPVVGGFLLEHFWWGSVFLINLPVMAVLVLVGIKLIPESKNPDPGPWDLPSVALSLVGMIGVVYAIKELASHGPSLDAGLAALAGAGALTWFVRRQLTLPAPLLDMRLFRHRGFSGAVLADLLTILGLSGLVFFLSQFFQLVQGRQPLEAGLAELPAAVGAVTAGLVAGVVARRFSVRSVVAGGLAAVGLALAVLTGLDQHTGYPLLGSALLVVGVGAGFSFTVTADVILSSVPKEQAGSASAVSETAYELGAALGIAVLGSIVTGVYRGFPVPAGVPRTSRRPPTSPSAAPSRPPAPSPRRRRRPSSRPARRPSSTACGSRPASARRSSSRRRSRPGSCSGPEAGGRRRALRRRPAHEGAPYGMTRTGAPLCARDLRGLRLGGVHVHVLLPGEPHHLGHHRVRHRPQDVAVAVHPLIPRELHRLAEVDRHPARTRETRPARLDLVGADHRERHHRRARHQGQPRDARTPPVQPAVGERVPSG